MDMGDVSDFRGEFDDPASRVCLSPCSPFYTLRNLAFQKSSVRFWRKRKTERQVKKTDSLTLHYGKA